MAEASVAAPIFKKKGGGKRDVRARDVMSNTPAASTSAAVLSTPSTAPQDDGDEGNSTVVLKKCKLGIKGASNPLLQSTGFASARKAAKDAEEEDADEADTRLDRYGESSVSSVVRADPSSAVKALDNRGDATRESEWYDADGSSGFAGNREGGENNDDGVYRGKSSYNTFITPRDDGISSKFKAATKGPVKGGSNVRTITLVDYQPDVCKDYKETGYCGFGDTCKFMHDRSDYLAGWQLDSLPNSAARRRGGGDTSDDEVEEEEIPFACLLCRKPFTDPIITKCGHYFCSACAIKRFSKTSKCFACGKQTQGIFNSATKVLERMEKARKTREEEREQRRWNRGNGPAEEQAGDIQSGELIDGVEIGGGDD